MHGTDMKIEGAEASKARMATLPGTNNPTRHDTENAGITLMPKRRNMFTIRQDVIFLKPCNIILRQNRSVKFLD